MEYTTAFFDHYYHNQWLVHIADGNQYDDETVLRINKEDNKVVSVFGNEYDRKGRLLYSGDYKKCKYNGHGKMYTESQDFYEGNFVNGKREGTFYLKSERYIREKVQFMNDKRHGECIEYYNDGESIHCKCQYMNDKKNGDYIERSGTGSLLVRGKYMENVREGTFYIYKGPTVCEKGEYHNGAFCKSGLCYHPVLKDDFSFNKTFYNDVYLSTEPERFISYDDRFAFCHYKDAELYIDASIITQIKDHKETNKDCLKPIKNISCSSVVFTSNNIDVIDFQDIWDILLDLTMLTYVSLKKMKLKNVHVVPGMVVTTMSELVFDNCSFDDASFESPLSASFTAVRFIHCQDLKRIYVKQGIFSQVKTFDVNFCPDIEEISIEDNNCPDVSSFVLEEGVNNLKSIKLGKNVFSNCCEFSIKNAQTLESITFGKSCCRSGNHFRITKAPVLKTIQFDDFCFMNGCSIQMYMVPQLQSITMGGACFKAINTIIIHDAPAFAEFIARKRLNKKPKIEYLGKCVIVLFYPGRLES